MRVGQAVQCPTDRGDPAYPGVIVRLNHIVNYNYLGVPYVWLEVKGNNKHCLWPSHRLGFVVEAGPKPPTDTKSLKT